MKIERFNENKIVTLDDVVKHMDGVFFIPFGTGSVDITEAWKDNLEYLTRRISESPEVFEYFRQVIRSIEQKRFDL